MNTLNKHRNGLFLVLAVAVCLSFITSGCSRTSYSAASDQHQYIYEKPLVLFICDSMTKGFSINTMNNLLAISEQRGQYVDAMLEDLGSTRTAPLSSEQINKLATLRTKGLPNDVIIIVNHNYSRVHQPAWQESQVLDNLNEKLIGVVLQVAGVDAKNNSRVWTAAIEASTDYGVTYMNFTRNEIQKMDTLQTNSSIETAINEELLMSVEKDARKAAKTLLRLLQKDRIIPPGI